MRETWYVLDDGEVVDPAEVTTADNGSLVHMSGVAVAMRNGVPHSRGVDDPDAARAAAAQEREMTNTVKTLDAASAIASGQKSADEARAEAGLPSLASTDAPKATRETVADREKPAKTTREITAEKPKRGYKTRGA